MYVQDKGVEIIQDHLVRYLSIYTCGSFFINFHVNEVPYFIKDLLKKLIFIVYYLNKIGINGLLHVGNVAVFH
mgnify:CR=1 FL=1